MKHIIKIEELQRQREIVSKQIEVQSKKDNSYEFNDRILTGLEGYLEEIETMIRELESAE